MTEENDEKDGREVVKRPIITTDDKGKFELISIESQMKYAQTLIENRQVSESFKTPQQVVLGIQYSKALGIDPIVGLQQMYIIKGKPAIFGDAPLTLAKKTHLITGMEEYFVDKDSKRICVQNENLGADVFAAVCRIKRKGDPLWQEDFFSVKDMENAQLNSFVWKTYKRLMLRYRARSIALKSKFPDALAGIEIAEYHTESLPEQEIIDASSDEMANEVTEIFTKENKYEQQ